MMSVRRGIIRNDCKETFEKYILCDLLNCLPSQLDGEDVLLLREFLVISEEIKKIEREEMEKSKQAR